jgi:hypothetical protein
MRCTQCRMTNDEHLLLHGKSLEVHRIQPGSLYSVEGCVTLCKPCHGRQPKRAAGVPDLEGSRVSKPIAVDPDLYDRLKALADRNGRPVSWEIRLVLTKHVPENEPPVEE